MSSNETNDIGDDSDDVRNGLIGQDDIDDGNTANGDGDDTHAQGMSFTSFARKRKLPT